MIAARSTITIACVLVTGVASAALATVPPFVINESVTTLTFTGAIDHPDYGLVPLQPVSSGAAVTHYGGDMQARRFLEPLSFRGGDVNAFTNGTYLPGEAPGNYGFQASLPGPTGNILATLRNFSFELVGNTADTGSGYNVADVDVVATSGVFVCDKLPTLSLPGKTAVAVYGTASITTQNLIEQHLRMPIGMSFSEQIPGSDYVLHFTLTGTVQAVRTLPEPSALMLLGAGALVVLRRRRPMHAQLFVT